MRHLTKILAVTVSICAVSAAAKAQQKELPDASISPRLPPLRRWQLPRTPP